MSSVSAQKIKQAKSNIAPYLQNAPILSAPKISKVLGAKIMFKPEFQQETGSFKIRGALNAMISLSDEERAIGVATASSGNHGPALACAARKFDSKATIFLSHLVPENKRQNVIKNGGTVKIIGKDYDESLEHCLEFVNAKKMKLVHPFDDPAIVCGAGTIGMEILEETQKEINCILVPVSGGGMLAGIATAIKAYKPNIRIIGVSMENGASMYNSIKMGKPVNVQEEETIADALGGNIGLENKITFPIVKKLVDSIVTVSEESIERAIKLIFDTEGYEVEGAGAVGVAAIMSEKVPAIGNMICILSGKNISKEFHSKIINYVRKQDDPGNPK